MLADDEPNAPSEELRASAVQLAALVGLNANDQSSRPQNGKSPAAPPPPFVVSPAKSPAPRRPVVVVPHAGSNDAPRVQRKRRNLLSVRPPRVTPEGMFFCGRHSAGRITRCRPHYSRCVVQSTVTKPAKNTVGPMIHIG